MGDPDQLTLQAIRALNEVDVFFVIDKGGATRELVELRSEICARHITGDYRFVEIPEVERDRTSPAYREAVVDWHEQRARAVRAGHPGRTRPGWLRRAAGLGRPVAVRQHHPDRREHRASREAGCRVSGDPGHQQRAATRRGASDRAQRCRRAGADHHRAPARAGGGKSGAENIVVMLDGDLACRALTGGDWEIYWGAYLGSPDETLIAGRLADVDRARSPSPEQLSSSARVGSWTPTCSADPGAPPPDPT